MCVLPSIKFACLVVFRVMTLSIKLACGLFCMCDDVMVAKYGYFLPQLIYFNSYNNLLEKKDLEILKMCERLEGGLTKLSEATEQLNELNKKLAVQKVSFVDVLFKCVRENDLFSI